MSFLPSRHIRLFLPLPCLLTFIRFLLPHHFSPIPLSNNVPYQQRWHGTHRILNPKFHAFLLLFFLSACRLLCLSAASSMPFKWRPSAERSRMCSTCACPFPLLLFLLFFASLSAFSPARTLPLHAVNRIPRQPPGEGTLNPQSASSAAPSPAPFSVTAQSHLAPAFFANFSSHRAAFASKLTSPVAVVDSNLVSSFRIHFELITASFGKFPRHSSPLPQFVANNGPLIRAPDGQFVLASVVPQQQTPASDSDQNSFSLTSVGAIQSTEVPSPPNGSSSSSSTSTDSSPTADTLPTTLPALPVDKSVDLDGDGALSLGEVQYAAFVHHGLSSSVVENLFNEVDRNKDSYLSSSEFNDIRPLVLAKAENAALRYLQNVDTDHNGQLSLSEAQGYVLKEYGISNRDVERIWRLVVPSSGDEMDPVLFSKLRRRIRGMSIRLARQIMKGIDRDEDGQVNLREAQLIAFEQEGIGPGEVVEMLASVDDNNDGQLNAPEFADFERIVRARAVETSKKALKVVDTDGNNALTLDEAKKIAFEHYGFDEVTLEPFFAQADENEDSQLDPVEFAGFRSVIRGRAVKNAGGILSEMDEDGDGMVSESEAVQKTRQEDDMNAAETHGLFIVADQDKNGLLDKVELADFIRLVRLTAIKFVADHFRDYDLNRDRLITVDELETLIKERYKLGPAVTRKHFNKVDLDRSGDLSPGEVVDFRHEIRRFAQDKAAQKELEEQNRREMAVMKTETTTTQQTEGDERKKEQAEGEEREKKEQVEEEEEAEKEGDEGEGETVEGRHREEPPKETAQTTTTGRTQAVQPKAEGVGAGEVGKGVAKGDDEIEAVQTRADTARAGGDGKGVSKTTTPNAEGKGEGQTEVGAVQTKTDEIGAVKTKTDKAEQVQNEAEFLNAGIVQAVQTHEGSTAVTKGVEAHLSSPSTTIAPPGTVPTSAKVPSEPITKSDQLPSASSAAVDGGISSLITDGISSPAGSSSPTSASSSVTAAAASTPPAAFRAESASSTALPQLDRTFLPASPPPQLPSINALIGSSYSTGQPLALTSSQPLLSSSITPPAMPSKAPSAEVTTERNKKGGDNAQDGKSRAKNDEFSDDESRRQNLRTTQREDIEQKATTIATVPTVSDGGTTEAKRRHRKRRRKTTTVTTTTTTTTEAPTEEEEEGEGDDYEEEGEDEGQKGRTAGNGRGDKRRQ